MSLKLTAILALFLAVVASFVMFYERPRMEAESKAQADEQKYLDVTRQTVAKFKLTNRFGTFVAEKRGNDWHIVDPVDAPGNWERFETLVTAAKAVARGRVVVDTEAYGGAKLSDFGLEPPRISLRFEDQSGQDISLFFGDDNPARRAAYLSWSDAEKIVLTQRSNRDQFDLKLKDLRDRRVLPFDMDQVLKIVIKHQTKTIELERNGYVWEILGPRAYRGDASEINSLMGKVHSESIFEYVAETLENPAVYGLDNPEYVFSVIYADGKARTLSLGASETGSRTRLLYAHSSERPYVFLIEPFLTDFLDVQVSDLRYKRVFEFEREGVDRIQLAYPDSTVTCLLENGDWVVSQPTGFMANAVAIGHWIDKVHTMAVQDFVGPVAHPADFGLSNPILTVSLWRGSALKREVRIGGQNGTWYGLMTGSDEVFVFDPGIIPGLHLPLESAPGAAVRLGAE